ncbi:MAG: substrate-binding domain-containing protein [Burkholderiales bacterium]|nr:substrate-binding domain-containing protein [Phycisphaerae bacterium]
MSCYREIIRGINAFSQSRADWHTALFSPADNYVQLLRDLRPDGLILGYVHDAAQAAEACKQVRHVVGVCGQTERLGLAEMPQVESDDEAVGKLAAQHFLDRGFTNFSYVGSNDIWSQRRWAGYQQVVKEAGFEVSLQLFDPGSVTAGRGWEKPHYSADMVTWLSAQKKPLALLACNDVRGRDVTETCRDAGVHVPDEVAILGVDDDDLDCVLSHPHLSSVVIPWQRIGSEAASLVDRAMDGEIVLSKMYGVPPVGIAERQSTDTLAISDVDVAAAIRFIRENAHQQIGVEDVLRAVPVARRSMEVNFRKLLGRSPHDEIRRVRLATAKHLLAGTELTMPAVAERSGFGNAARFSTVFHSEVGETPSEYRKRYRR